ncbi:MAG: hypothetical protein IMZ62_10540 [Chloroflexi bacterium]|nr:hypothetical protein [Chloroflexota bacterium]
MRRLVVAVALLLFIFHTGTALAQQDATRTPPGTQAAPTQREATLTNSDIIKMVKAKLADDVIVASIKTTLKKSFDLSPDRLIELKTAGVSDKVLLAMQGQEPPAVQPRSPTSTARPGAVAGASGFGISDVGLVQLITKDRGSVELRSSGGTMSTTYAFVTVLTYCNFAGLKADTRTTDHRPILIVRSPKSPRGRMYLVSAEVDKRNTVRSVKMGNARPFGAINIGAPDSSNQIDCDIVEEGPDTWRVTPKKILKAGEYGLWISTMEMYEFGIDG